MDTLIELRYIYSNEYKWYWSSVWGLGFIILIDLLFVGVHLFINLLEFDKGRSLADGLGILLFQDSIGKGKSEVFGMEYGLTCIEL